jgi:hypothetical protein
MSHDFWPQSTKVHAFLTLPSLPSQFRSVCFHLPQTRSFLMHATCITHLHHHHPLRSCLVIPFNDSENSSLIIFLLSFSISALLRLLQALFSLSFPRRLLTSNNIQQQFKSRHNHLSSVSVTRGNRHLTMPCTFIAFASIRSALVRPLQFKVALLVLLNFTFSRHFQHPYNVAFPASFCFLGLLHESSFALRPDRSKLHFYFPSPSITTLSERARSLSPTFPSHYLHNPTRNTLRSVFVRLFFTRPSNRIRNHTFYKILALVF